MNKCCIDGCEGKHKGHGYCNKHYQRFKNNGDPLIVRAKTDHYPDICTVENCNEEYLAQGYCNKHYIRWKTYGDPLFERYPDACTIPGCERPYAQKGLCIMHYTRKRKHGDPLKVINICGFETFIECLEANIIKNTENGCWEWQGATRKGYGWMCVNHERIAVHRFSYAHFIAPISDDLFVCHHCDNRLCCNPEHLFLGTHSDNMQDCIKKNRHRWRK